MAIDHTIIGIKRFDRLLSDVYGIGSLTTYKRIPRTHSFSEIDGKALSNTKDSTSTMDARCTAIAPLHSQKDAAAESGYKDNFGRKPIYSRQLSRSTNFLPFASKAQKNIIYNWSGLHEIARETQVLRPNNVNQLVRLVRTATSKVGLS